MMDAGEYSSSSSAEYLRSYFNNNNNNNNSSSSSCSSNSKRKKTKTVRRFRDDQITSLETIFYSETKLEPRKKLQLARELGLQPRQVAIWFQNKRARCKSKQIERDYTLLKSDYDHLAFQFDSLKKERQTLRHQLQKLNGLIDKSEAKEGRGHEASDDHDGPGPGDSTGGARDEFKVKKTSPFLDLERTEYGELNSGAGDVRSSRNNPDSYLGLEEEAAAELPLNILEPANSCSLTEPEEWGALESADPLDHPSNGYKWWDFWS